MRVYETKDRSDKLICELLIIWEKSVRATHLFLSDEEIQKITVYVISALQQIQYLIVAVDDNEKALAFMGIEDKKLEMLFVSSEERGKGRGKKLLQYGLKHYSVNELCVNEQNPQATEFYEHMGFQCYKRTDLDEQGNSYPLLYMRFTGNKF